MDVLFSLIVFIFGILNIILFFKIWGMTNNVTSMKETLSQIEKYIRPKEEAKDENVSSLGRFSIDDLVVIKATEKQTHIAKIINGEYECYSGGGMNYDGLFTDDELYTWEEYLETIKK